MTKKTPVLNGLMRQVIIMLFVTMALPAYQVQEVRPGDEIATLVAGEEKPRHTWWYTTRQINALQESKRLLPGTEDRPASYFKPTQLPHRLTAEPGKRRVVYYRKVFSMPAGKGAEKPLLTINLAEINDRDRAYLNGVLIGQTGEFGSEYAQAYDRQRIYDIPPGAVRWGENNVLLVEVEGYSETFGISKRVPFIGERSLLQRYHLVESFITTLFLIAYFVPGLYFLFLFLRIRQFRSYLFFGLFAISFGVYQFLRTQLRFELGWNFLEVKRVEYIILLAQMPLFYYFLRYYFGSFLPGRWQKYWDAFIYGICGCYLLAAGFTVFNNSANDWWALQLYFIQPTWLPFLLGGLYTVGLNAYRGERDAFYILGGFLINLAGMIFDLLISRGEIDGVEVSSYLFVLFLLSLALILANRFVRMHQQVTDLNENLESKVQEQTQQIRTALEETQQLKLQQDGDYFLTSLLVKPLSGSFTRGESNVDVSFFSLQKKQFVFKKWQAEIGGDINIVNHITLQGRKYLVFLNGDAMGKSMQGAGGALVLGTVFKSVVTRTNIVAGAGDMFPEQWLRDCYWQLQDVFVSFDGTMLISGIVGLVDENNGLVFFLNAEHPRMVLLRDNKASFAPENLELQKIGIANELTELYINVFKLMKGDRIFIGSDGKDDLVTGHDAEGNRQINEDETRFLRLLEQKQGDMAELETYFKESDALIDDVSLMALCYQAEFDFHQPGEADRVILLKAQQLAQGSQVKQAIDTLLTSPLLNESAELSASLGQLYFKSKDFEQAAGYFSQASELDPLNNRYLFKAALAFRRSKKIRQALLWADRLYLRDPLHFDNLLNLVDCHRLLGQNQQAGALLKRARRISKDSRLDLLESKIPVDKVEKA